MDAAIGWEIVFLGLGVVFHGSRQVPARGGPATESDDPDDLDVKTPKNPN